MEELINWLIEFETTAAEFYEKFAHVFKVDTSFASLLMTLSSEEREHASIIAHGRDALLETGIPPSLIMLDLSSKRKIERYFAECNERHEKSILTKADLIEYIIKAEFSEWNTIFVYILGALKDVSEEFAEVPSKIQKHKRRIENYLENLDPSADGVRDLLHRVKELPDACKKRFLLAVDDDSSIIDLLVAILETKGTVDSASNGKEAFDLVSDRFYDIIITDVNMPVMTGIEFYNSISKKYPSVGSRILFFTGEGSEKDIRFFKDNNLRYLIKPSTVDRILFEVHSIMGISEIGDTPPGSSTNL